MNYLGMKIRLAKLERILNAKGYRFKTWPAMARIQIDYRAPEICLFADSFGTCSIKSFTSDENISEAFRLADEFVDALPEHKPDHDCA